MNRRAEHIHTFHVGSMLPCSNAEFWCRILNWYNLLLLFTFRMKPRERERTTQHKTTIISAVCGLTPSHSLSPLLLSILRYIPFICALLSTYAMMWRGFIMALALTIYFTLSLTLFQVSRNCQQWIQTHTWASCLLFLWWCSFYYEFMRLRCCVTVKVEILDLCEETEQDCDGADIVNWVFYEISSYLKFMESFWIFYIR